MNEHLNDARTDDEREEVDAVEEIAEQEPPRPEQKPEADAAEEVAERAADDYEEQDTRSGDDPPAF